MTRPTRSPSTFTDTRGRTAAVAVALAALALLGATAAGTAAAQTDGPTVVVGDASTTPDETTTVDVVLTSVPDGLSGYYLELSVEASETARIQSASYPDRFGLTSEPAIGDDGGGVALEAADIEGAIGPGATDVTLATVTVAGVEPGEVGVAVEPRQFDADDGSAFTPDTRSATVTVAGDDASSTDDAASGGSDDAASADGAAAGGSEAEATSNDLPLSPVLALVAIGLFAAAGVRRRG